MMLTYFDYGVAAVLLLSAFLGMLRGLVRELLALAGWLVAAFVAWRYHDIAARWLPDALPGADWLRQVLGFVMLFVLTLVVTGLAAALLAQLVRSTGLTPVDRGLGFVFGLLRGTLILIALIWLAGLTDLPQQPFWRDAVTRPCLDAAFQRVQSWLPDLLARSNGI